MLEQWRTGSVISAVLRCAVLTSSQGLITGRTTAFCLDPKKSGVNAQKNVATTQSHEVSAFIRLENPIIFF